jgi:hypothetical protein
MRRRYSVLFLIALSCAAASFPEYPLKRAVEYGNVVSKSGIVVAAVPVEDPEDQRKYFGMDLKVKGYVPVFLVMENEAPVDSFLLGKEALTYSAAGISASTLANPGKSSKADKTLAVASYVPYYGIMATVLASKSKELRQNILKTELQSATLSPGTSVHGFVFIPVPWRHSSRNKIELSISFKVPQSGEVVVIDLTV